MSTFYQPLKLTLILILLTMTTNAHLESSGHHGQPTHTEHESGAPVWPGTRPSTMVTDAIDFNNWLDEWRQTETPVVESNHDGPAREQAVTQTSPPSVGLSTSRPVSTSVRLNGTATSRSANVPVNISSIDTDSDGNHPSDLPDPYYKERLPPHGHNTPRTRNGTGSNVPDEDDILMNNNIKQMDVRKFVSVDKLIVVVAIVSGCFLLFVICLIVCLRRRAVSAPSGKTPEMDDTASIPPVSRKMSQVSHYTVEEEDKDSFMGIPTNHQIWKELQVMSAESPVVAEAKQAEEKPPL